MTINAVSRSFACAPSSDGVRYTKFPGGDDPGMPATETDLASILYYQPFESVPLSTDIGTLPYIRTTDGVVANDPLSEQGRVVEDQILVGETAYGEWGFALRPFGADLVKGDEVWFSIRVMFPTGFDYNADPHLKFIRFHTVKADGVTNGGYIDLYLNPTTSHPPVWKYIKEAGDGWHTLSASDAPVLNQWETYEVHVVLDNVAAGSGGNGHYDFWKNGVYVGGADAVTLTDATDLVEAIYMFTYWNGGSPATQTAYYTDVAVAVKRTSRDDTAHMILDAGNRPYIGMA